MDDGLTLRLLQKHEWAAAMTLAARSFHGEPFSTALFGEEPVRRFAQAHRFYQALTWYDADPRSTRRPLTPTRATMPG